MGEETSCYICLEPCSDFSACACIGRYVHTECLLKLHSAKNTVDCTVCKAPIRTLCKVSKRQKQLSRDFAITLIAFSSFCVMIAMATYVGLYAQFRGTACAGSLVMYGFGGVGAVIFLRGVILHCVQQVPIVVVIESVKIEIVNDVAK